MQGRRQMSRAPIALTGTYTRRCAVSRDAVVGGREGHSRVQRLSMGPAGATDGEPAAVIRYASAQEAYEEQ